MRILGRAILFMGLVLGHSTGFGALSTTPLEKMYGFKFKMQTPQKQEQTFEYATKAQSYEDAFEKAAQACFTHYKDGKRVTEDRGLDIIDVCANPRNI